VDAGARRGRHRAVVHAVGEPTAPSIREGDGLVMISGDPQVYAAMMGRYTNLQ